MFVYVKPKIPLTLVHPKIKEIEKKSFKPKRNFKTTSLAKKIILQVFEILLQRIFLQIEL
jgi:hypothetical protein